MYDAFEHLRRSCTNHWIQPQRGITLLKQLERLVHVGGNESAEHVAWTSIALGQPLKHAVLAQLP